MYQPRLQLPDIWKQPAPQRPAKKEEPLKMPMHWEAHGKGPQLPPRS